MLGSSPDEGEKSAGMRPLKRARKTNSEAPLPNSLSKNPLHDSRRLIPPVFQ
jgi:hypothetical protein